MFLFALLLAYLVVRLYEDTTATIRGHEPPRHEYRKKKLEARADGGRPVPASSFGRYMAGLLDDAWDSAHHKRELMAEHRKEKRERKAAEKINRDREKWALEDAAADGDPAEPVAVDPAGFDATLPEPAVIDGAAAGAETPAGAGDEAKPARPKCVVSYFVDGKSFWCTNDALEGRSTCEQHLDWVSRTAATTPPTAAAAAPAPGPAAPAAARGGAGFNATAPTAADVNGVPRRELIDEQVHGGWTRPVGDATRALATDLTVRAAQYAASTDMAAKASEAMYPITPAQQDTVDAVHNAINTGVHTQIPASEWMALPVATRADMLDAIRTTPGVHATVVPGGEDVEALALLSQRYGGAIDPADIYCAPPDAPPEVQEAVAEDLRRIAEAEAAAKAGEKTDGAAEESSADAATSTKEASADNNTTALPDNVIPFKQRSTTTTRMELPVTSTEITGLEAAISYAAELSAYCTHTRDQISAVVPTGDEAAASCEKAQADLAAGGVTGQALTDVASVQEQMTAAVAELNAALAQLEAAGAAATSLQGELESHRGVKEAYNATPDAGNKEFVTAE